MKWICILLFSILVTSLFAETNSKIQYEFRIGASASSVVPEFSNRFKQDDLLAGGNNGQIGFGAQNGNDKEKSFASFANPLEFKIKIPISSFHALLGAEVRGVKGVNFSTIRSNFNYPATGFFKGNGTIHSSWANQNFRLGIEKQSDSITYGFSFLFRRFTSDMDRDLNLYSAGFYTIIKTDSSYTAGSVFPALHFSIPFGNGKLYGEAAYLPSGAGSLGSNGMVTQTGFLKFPFDPISNTPNSELSVVNFLYGKKQPEIYGSRYILEYIHPILENLSIALTFYYDRLYVKYPNYSPGAFYKQTSTSTQTGNSQSATNFADAEVLSSYYIYRQPLLNEIRTIQLGVIISF